MADNVRLNAGVGGELCATDDAGAAGQIQIVKLAIATDGSATPIPADAKGMKVQQDTAADLKATVILAAGTAEFGKLAAGTALIGKVGIDQATANANEVVVKSITAGDNNIGNVDIVTVPAPLNVAGAGTELAAQRVTIATDCTGQIKLAAGVASIGKLTDDQKIDLNKVAGASVAVSTGTAATSIRTVTASDSPDTVSLAIMDDWDESDRAKVNIIAGQAGVAGGAGAVGATVPRVTLASDDPAVTALQLLDNSVDGNYLNVNMNLAGADAPSGAGTEAGALRVTLPTDGTGVVKLGAGTAEVGKLAAGTALIGDVNLGLRTSGGATPYSYISDGTDFVSVTDGATTLYAITCTSIDATVVYIKFYDKATAPDPSADAASIKLRFAVPSMATGAGFIWSVPQGMDFPTGLGFALVTGAADTDETAVTANEVMVNLVYKH